MRILDRYIIGSVAAIFSWCLVVFFFLFIIIDLFSHLDVILSNKTDIHLLLVYYTSIVPVVFIQIAPFACLLATLYTFAKFNHDNEIIAMRSSGMSIFTITRTVLVFGLLISLGVFLIADRIAPRNLAVNLKTKEIIESGENRPRHKEPERIDNLAIYGLKNRLVFAKRFYPPQQMLEGIVILEHDNKQNVTKKVEAARGMFRDGLWKFYQSITYSYDENGQMAEDPQYLEEEVMSLAELPEDFVKQRQTTDVMSLEQLDDYIWRLGKSGATTVVRNLTVDRYHRIISPFTSLFIILIGIPFALKIKKRATGLSSFGVALVVGFLYYVANAVGIALGKSGTIPWPLVSASLAHLLVLFFSLWMIFSLP